MAAAPKILVKAFEPFGIRKLRLIGGNRSSDLLERLRARRIPGCRYHYVVLPVDESALVAAEKELGCDINGALLMGEQLLSRTTMEMEAYDHRAWQQLGPVRLPGAKSVPSSFGREVAGKPSAFVHVGVLQSIDRQYAHVAGLLVEMAKHTATKR